MIRSFRYVLILAGFACLFYVFRVSVSASRGEKLFGQADIQAMILSIACFGFAILLHLYEEIKND